MNVTAKLRCKMTGHRWAVNTKQETYCLRCHCVKKRTNAPKVAFKPYPV